MNKGNEEREKRQELIRSIEKKRGSKVICYITSDRHGLSVPIAEDVVSILHEHVLAIDPPEREKLDLLIYSRGGDSDVPWSIVSMFREYCKEGSFSVLVPYKAHSAATVISLGADEIVMTKKAELGPIDITINRGPYNPREETSKQPLPLSVEDVMGYFSLLEKMGCDRSEEKMKGFELLTQQVHPLVLGTVNRLLEQTQLVALRLLGTRAKPFLEEKNREIVKRLSSEIFSHRHSIHRTEAVEYLGLQQVMNAEDAGIDSELWEIYKEYRKLFQLEEPFRPQEYLEEQGLDAHTWKGLNLACIESDNRLDLLQQDMKVRVLRPVPPQVELKISLNAIKLPSLPSGLTAQQALQHINNILPSILQNQIEMNRQKITKKLLETLPSGTLEHKISNSGWRRLP